MRKIRTQTWIAGILAVVALPFLVIGGLWVYVSTTAKPLYPDPLRVPSVVRSNSPTKWAAAVEQGRQIIREKLAEQNLPGLSVAVGIGGDIVWAEGFGFADLEHHIPVTPDHRFRIGTATTMLTSAAIGLLVDQDQLKLEDEIQTHVPEFPKKQWPVTIRQVMGHVGGIKTEDVDNGVLTSDHCGRPADAVALFAKEPLLFQPGTEYRFSTFGWALLSAVIEAAAHQPFTMFLEDTVFRPLGMVDTVRDSETGPVPHEATAYYPRFGGNPILGLPRYGMNPLYRFNYSCYAGASGFLSTPSDLVRFGMAINDGKLLRRDTVQALQTSQRLASGKDTGSGLGWNLKTVTLEGKQVRAAGQDGYFWVGRVASVLTFPERRMAVAVTSNIPFGDPLSLAERISQAFAEHGGTPAAK